MASRSLHTGVFLYFAILFKEFKKPRNNKNSLTLLFLQALLIL